MFVLNRLPIISNNKIITCKLEILTIMLYFMYFTHLNASDQFTFFICIHLYRMLWMTCTPWIFNPPVHNQSYCVYLRSSSSYNYYLPHLQWVAHSATADGRSSACLLVESCLLWQEFAGGHIQTWLWNVPSNANRSNVVLQWTYRFQRWQFDGCQQFTNVSSCVHSHFIHLSWISIVLLLSCYCLFHPLISYVVLSDH